MTSEKQIEANYRNSLHSTGPKTTEGKDAISQNALRHGIFSKETIITTGDGKENEEEFQALIDNLVESLHPNGQFELLLVEKIAVDTWRLKRVLRFETGSIRKFSDMMISNLHKRKDSHGNKVKSNEELDEEIIELKEFLESNTAYLECLERYEVDFSQRTWEKGEIVRDIEEDIHQVFEVFGNTLLDSISHVKFKMGQIDFNEMRKILAERNYTDKHIAGIVMHYVRIRNEEYQSDIANLEEQKQKNLYSEEVIPRINSIPFEFDAEKVMRYETFIQKSIFQNLMMLKKVQSSS